MGFHVDDLGGVQFERLCDALLALDPELAARRPVVAWVRHHAPTLAPEAGVVLTNRPDAFPDVETLGPDELWSRYASMPRLRLLVPSALGVGDLDALTAEELRRRSTADVAAARALARVFVPTRAYLAALGVVEQHRFVVLTGPPEMGKTAIARMLGLAFLTVGYELHECLRPDELWQRYDRGRAQVFVADDAFGSTEYRPEAAERWATELDRVLRALDERHLLIWTSRPAPLKAALQRIHREHGVERFPRPAEVQVDAARLDVEEKALILFRHAKAARLNRARSDLVRMHGREIVAHEHFTPERIRRFVARLPSLPWEGDLAALVAAEIREPTEAMAASYRALEPRHRAVLLALLDAPPGPVAERELAASLRRHLDEPPHTPVAELVDRLADHFVRVAPPASVTWVHPSWRDLVVEELAADGDARRRFLRAGTIHGLLLALSTGGGAAGERALPLLRDDADWDALADRLTALAAGVDTPDTVLLLGALTEARRAAPSPELDALAAYTLELLAHRRDVLPVPLLARWYELAADLPEPRQPPAAATWIEVAPVSRVDLTDVEEVARLEDWTVLVDLLAEHDPPLLAQVGFPERYREPVRGLGLDALVLHDVPHRVLLSRVLLWLSRQWPDLDEPARAWWRRREDEPRATYEEHPTYRDLSPELARLLAQPLPSQHDEERIVTRVLRDL